MTKSYSIFATCVFSSIIIYAFVFQGVINEKQILQTENSELQQENQKLKAQTEYMAFQRNMESLDMSYNTWSVMEKQAINMVEDSNGEFKKAWALFLANEAKQYNINPFLAYELLKVETGGTFDPTLKGPETLYGQAYGLAQFMKNTAPWIAEMAGLPYEDELLFDPYYSMKLSLVYLDFLHDQYGNWNEALTAYHRGMGGLEQYKKENGHAASSYATIIQENAENHAELVVVR